MRSIERTLSAWILGALSLGTLVVALVTYLVTLEEMHEVFDTELKNVAEAVARYHDAGQGGEARTAIAAPPRTDTPGEYEILTATWTLHGKSIFSSDARVPLPFSATEGLARPSVQGEVWIVYSSVGTDGVVQAAQRLAARQDMAGESAAKVFPPLIGLGLVIGGLLVFGLRRGLQPLDGTAKDVAQRSARSLEPITLTDVPKEITPLVHSINDLMHKLALALATQRRFLADAAHELRTPITALRLQLQLLQRSGDGAAQARAMADLAAGIDRSQRLVEQLLQVARSDPDGELTQLAPVDLAALVRETVATLSVKADHKGLDLGADAPDAVTVQGDMNQLTVLINNLVENALRYTPAGGVVDVSAKLHEGRPLLRVVDNGPGIDAADHERVFDRFYRGAMAPSPSSEGGGPGSLSLSEGSGSHNIGSGLGLAIVRAIAQRHGAQVSLHRPSTGQGLDVQVLFPPSPAHGRASAAATNAPHFAL